MSKIPSTIRIVVYENFHGLAFFFCFMQWRFYFVLVTSVLAGLLDGFILAMLIPLNELMGWAPEITVDQIIEEMVEMDLLLSQKQVATNLFENVGSK